MSNDKPPKHKPQQKHTLSEVLKSLQDLIRTDLITAQGAAKPSRAKPVATPTPTAAPAPPPAATEPDSFNDALNQLDRMITHNIIEPVERARETPPEALLPDEVLEIEWDDATPHQPQQRSEPADTGTADTPVKAETAAFDAPSPTDAEPTHANDNVIELEALEAKAIDDDATHAAEVAAPRHTDNIVPLEVLVIGTTEDPAPQDADAPEETIELHDAVPDPQGAFDFASARPAAPDSKAVEVIEPAHPLNETAKEPAERLAVIDWEPAAFPTAQPTPAEQPLSPGDTTADRTVAHAPPVPPTEQIDSVPTLTIEFEIADVAAPAPETVDPVTVTIESPQAPRELAADTPTRKGPPSENAADSGKRKPDAPTTPLQEEIPTLKEIAEVIPPPVSPLPDAKQARDIAIRVIAKLNIERRKAGEAPLDIKTIEKLQQYLADALTKRALNKPK